MKIYKSMIMAVLIAAMTFSMVACGDSLIQKVSDGLTEYNMDIVFDDDDMTMTVSQNICYVNNTGVYLDDIAMHLYAIAYSQDAVNKAVYTTQYDDAYPNGISYGDIEISSIMVNDSDVDATYQGDDDSIMVLPLSLDINKTANIYIEYIVTLANIDHRLGYGDDSINMANFYPIVCVYDDGWIVDEYHSSGDPFYSDIANYNVSIKVPSDYTLASTGNQQTVIDDDIKTVSISALAVRDFAMVMSEKYYTISSVVDGVTVNYYYYEGDDEEYGLTAACDSIQTFSNMFMDYPYEQISVVMADFVHGGMEYPQLVYISDDLDSDEQIAQVIIHEIAHQWWYGIVGNDEYNEAWLDEGLAEYSTALFYKKHSEYGVDYNEYIDNYIANMNLFMSVYTDVLGNVDSSMNRSLNEYSTDAEYIYMNYVKGVLMYDTLASVMGYDTLISSLSYYCNANAFCIAHESDIIYAFEYVSGSSMSGYFDSWLNGKVIL